MLNMISHSAGLSGMHRKKRTSDIMTIALLVLISLIMLFPIYIMLITSFKTKSEIMMFPPTIFPKKPTVDNFGEIFKAMNFAVLYKNSMFVSTMVALGSVISSSFVAFGFYRYKAPGKNVLFAILLSTMMIPYSAFMIPQFILFMNLGWVNTFLPLIVPYFFGSAYMIFLFRQFYGTITYELFEASRIDGAGEILGYWKIAMPLCGPAIAAVAIFSFIWSWDDILGPVIYLNDPRLFTLPIAMSGFKYKFTVVPWHYIMAGALSICLPCLLLFIFCQRYFVEGIVLSGIKA
jgi:multiple sugar transport system permease protein